MTLPVSGAISFNAINVELNVAGTTTASLGQATYRTLAGIPTGAIALSNFYGLSNTFSFSIAGGNNINLRSAAVAAGWDQTKTLLCTITSTINSASTGSPALTINGSFPYGLTMTVNSGVIIAGKGGDGGTDPYSLHFGNGQSGGTALSVSSACTIINNGAIGGGGGGGASVVSGCCCGRVFSAGGGGGGFGAAGTSSIIGGDASAGGQSSGGNGANYNGSNYGGAAGQAGGSGVSSGRGGGGGGLGFSGGTASGSTEGSGGNAVAGNSNVTWSTLGTIYGARV